MTRQYRIPDSWRFDESSGLPQTPAAKPTGADQGGRSLQRPVKPAVPPKSPTSTPAPLGNPEAKEPIEPPSSPSPAPKSPKKRRTRSFLWATRLRSWFFLCLLLGGTAGLSALILLKVPALPNCPGIFWPLASASLRVSCAQNAAEKQTIPDLLYAIDLVHDLPADHEMRPLINQSIERWSADILRLCEQLFQEGKLSEAIENARKIPANTTAYRQVQRQIDRWNGIWSRANLIYQRAEEELREGKYHQAFRQAVRLLYIGNAYWETTKYRELNNHIRSTREGSRKLAEANRLADLGGLDNLLKAIQIAESVNPQSYLFRQARRASRKFARNLITLAQATLDQGDLQAAIAIVKKLPASVGMQSEAEDFITLAQAQSQAWKSTVADLESAIAQAQSMRPGRPLYSKAQKLIVRWQLEIEALAHLEKARQLAQGGSIIALQAAIAEASSVPSSNPRIGDVRKEVQNWTNELQKLEDQPFLEQAEALALPGDVISLQAAIDQADRIRPGRALYRQAQAKVKGWTRRIQEIQDRPFLDQAEALAQNGDIPGAIAAANMIPPGRALREQAQSKVSVWQANTNAQQYLQEAYSLADVGTPDALVRAIRTANRVSSLSSRRSEAQNAIDRWSEQMLTAAESQVYYNQIQSAITIAEKIPPRTAAYDRAQTQIAEWKKRLVPTDLEVVPPSPPVAP
ncbi:MAG: hypothetical protein SFW36_12820 [Leptolyngbyaceae cyanobacterium bins.59]|nr:hypothetical protein [Leptolyngbyaceae cyanobacterium bins.59]